MLWPVGSTADDKQRWQSQGFVFQQDPPFGLQQVNIHTHSLLFMNHEPHLAEPFCGVVQGHGGPCGVLAAVQAEVLRYLLFTHPSTDTQVCTHIYIEGQRVWVCV
jgi:hypothetical protein